MTPVLLFVYNRPQHLKQTLQYLALNEGAQNTILIIYSDGPKTMRDIAKVEKVRELCKSLTGFLKVELVLREANIGLAKNIISGVSHEINRFGSVIVLEDDLLPSPGFLTYMNNALSYYKNSPVFSICAYSPSIPIPPEYNYSTYLTPRVGSWGWASWAEKWNSADWAVSDFSGFIRDRQQRRRFNKGGNDFSAMLINQKSGKIDSWAIRFAYHCYRINGKVVYPVKSLISNRGSDNSGDPHEEQFPYGKI